VDKEMEKKTTCLLIGLLVLVVIIFMVKGIKPHDEVEVQKDEQVKIDANFNETVGQEETVDNTPDSIAEMLQSAQRQSQDAPPKMGVFEELESLVTEAKVHYEEVFNEYKNAIKTYEMLSADFDAKIRQDADKSLLRPIEEKLQAQAQEVIRFKEKSNSAYLKLMASYDEAVPAILEKHF
jgi:hypothetical protein